MRLKQYALSQTQNSKTMESQTKTKKMIVIDPEKWKVIVNFISGLNVPIQQSAIAATVVQCINTAQEADLQVKEPDKPKK